MKRSGSLWDIGLKMLCSRCYMEDPDPKAVHGVLLGTMPGNILPQIPVDAAVKLEEKARVVWSSYWNRKATWTPRVVTGGYYAPAYTRIWAFKDKTPVHTVHSLD